jgi:hypothetical protein
MLNDQGGAEQSQGALVNSKNTEHTNFMMGVAIFWISLRTKKNLEHL